MNGKVQVLAHEQGCAMKRANFTSEAIELQALIFNQEYSVKRGITQIISNWTVAYID